jgi:hypothetical protein
MVDKDKEGSGHGMHPSTIPSLPLEVIIKSTDNINQNNLRPDQDSKRAPAEEKL